MLCVTVPVSVCVWQACYVLPVAQAVNYVRQHIELVRLIGGGLFCCLSYRRMPAFPMTFVSSFPSFLWHLPNVWQVTTLQTGADKLFDH